MPRARDVIARRPGGETKRYQPIGVFSLGRTSNGSTAGLFHHRIAKGLSLNFGCSVVTTGSSLGGPMGWLYHRLSMKTGHLLGTPPVRPFRFAHEPTAVGGNRACRR